MGATTKIRWADASWNPVTGCTKISQGCVNCYAERIAENKRGTLAFPNGFDIQLRPHKLRDPIKWKEPRRVFVNSMSDLFHPHIPGDYLKQVWDTMLTASHHTYQVLTKRTHRMAHKIEELGLETAPHIWLGTSAENQEAADLRLPVLAAIDTPVRFVSAEPLLGPLSLEPWIEYLHWVIVGGESGPGHRHMDYDWARQLRDEAREEGVAFFYKQGNAYSSDNDKVLDGETFDEYPEQRP